MAEPAKLPPPTPIIKIINVKHIKIDQESSRGTSTDNTFTNKNAITKNITIPTLCLNFVI